MVTTARDLLFAEVLVLLSKPFSDASLESLSDTLDRFRLQLKASVGGEGAKTARETMHHDLLQLWQTKNAQIDDGIRKIIDGYRMQVKSLSKTKGTKTKAVKKKEIRSAVPITVPAKKVRVEPISGGPQKRNRERSQCPKCRSMGVVLAHSFSGDDYFSCIYCGFQAYKAPVDSELDLPLAAELLGRTFDDNEEIELNE